MEYSISVADLEEDPQLEALWDEQDRILTNALGCKYKVRFSVSHPEDDYKNILFDTAVEGLCVFVMEDYIFSNGKTFISHIMNSPMWLDVAIQADKMIRKLKTGDHVYLENS